MNSDRAFRCSDDWLSECQYENASMMQMKDLLEKVIGMGHTFQVPFFEDFVRSRSRFRNFLSDQGHVC